MTTDLEDLVKLSFFAEIGKAISRAKTIDETLTELMTQIGDIFSPLNWSLLIINPKTAELTFTIVVGKNADKLRGLKLPKGEGIAGWIAETGQSVIIEEVLKDSRFSPRVDQFTGFVTESIIGVPLMTDGKVFGVIELINRLSGEPFTPLDLKILKIIADFAAIAIEKAYYLTALKRMADTDSLTGINNRGSFERFYIKEVEMCKRYGIPLSFLMVDIDDFKMINDEHGHPAGDTVLKNLAELLTSAVRKVDKVFRYGGDEFVILMPNTSKQQAMEARARIQGRIDYQNSLNPEIKYHISIGQHSMDSEDNTDILEVLDSNLYREKDKKFSKNIENLSEHLEDMLKEERSILGLAGKKHRH